jgi:hypothetical protein
MRTEVFSLRFAGCAWAAFFSLLSPNAFGQTLKQVTKFDLPGPDGTPE